MTQRRGGTRWGWLLASVVLGVGCGYGADNGDSGASSIVPPGYRLGGQTGSLVPDCGLAPLSAQGRSVPAGEALAVLYAGACPEPPRAEQLMLAGLSGAVAVELVPLGARGLYLVRAEQSLAGGDYQLVGAGSPSELRVSDGELQPPRLGALSQLPDAEECAEQLGFELTLDDTALAYAPLSRFELSIDHGPAEVWVDYGALPIESRAQGSVGLLDLPRCGTGRCLTPGQHVLQLTLSVAGESAQPAPLELAFAVDCSPAAEASAGPAGTDDSGASCAVAAPGSHPASPDAGAGFTALLTALLGAALCSARRRTRARSGNT